MTDLLTPEGRLTIADWQREVGRVNAANGWRQGTAAEYATPTKQVAILALIVANYDGRDRVVGHHRHQFATEAVATEGAAQAGERQ